MTSITMTIMTSYIERCHLELLNLQSKHVGFEDLTSSSETSGFQEELKRELVNDSLFDDLHLMKDEFDQLVPRSLSFSENGRSF